MNDIPKPRVVMVTGAADGIGRVTSGVFAEAGERVAMLDHDKSKLDQAADTLLSAGHQILPLTVDVRDAASIQAAIDVTIQRWGRIDVAANVAGVYPNTPVMEMDEAEWDRVMDTNLKGTFLFCRAVARQMVEQGGGGKICTIASGAHRSARVGAGHYCASKAGVVLFSQVLALELAPHGINVNIVSPGFVDVGDRPGVSAEYRDTITKNIPWGRAGSPADIARVVAFVCSPAAEYMTGALVPVDGGSSAGRFFLPPSS